MEPGVGGSVVDEDGAVLFGDPAVGEDDVRDIADALRADGGDEVALRFGDDLGGIFQFGEEEVEDVAQTGGRVADPVGEVQPAVLGFDRGRALAVLEFVDRVVGPPVDDGFLAGAGLFHRGAECPADAAAGACVDETVLRAGVERVFSANEFRVDDDVALLGRGGLDVRQALPFFQVLRAHEPALRDGAGLVVGFGFRVAALGAEEAVDPAVLVFHEPHVVDVGVGIPGFRDHAGLIPEPEPVDAVFGFGDGEETLAVPSFDPDANRDPAIPLDGSGIECGIDPEAFEEERVRLRVQIVAPFQRDVGRGDDRVHVALVNAVVP